MKITSLEAYEKIKKNGTLSKSRLQVYKFVCKNPNCTALDVLYHFKAERRSTITARFSELERRGFIKVTGKIEQEGYDRHTYEITGRTEPLSERVILAAELQRIESQISKLYAKAGMIRVRISKLDNTDQLGLGV